jgi:hypothetical protein
VLNLFAAIHFDREGFARLGTGRAGDGSFDRPDCEDFAGPSLSHLTVAAFGNVHEFVIGDIATNAGAGDRRRNL